MTLFFEASAAAPSPSSPSPFSLQTRTVPSVEEEAKVVASLQSTSRVGAILRVFVFLVIEEEHE